MSKEPKQIRTEIVINAAPEKVWNILINFESYPDWNPFIRSIRGNVLEGAQVVARIEPPGASGMTFKPKLLAIRPNSEFRWLGHLFVPGLFDGEHIFELYENTDGSTTFVHREIFSGVLVPLFKKMLDVNTFQGFQLMNAALKARAEGRSMPHKASTG